MDFAFDDEQQAYRQELRRFAAKVLAHYQADDRIGRLRPGLVTDMTEMGLTGLRIPARYGGQEAGAVVAGRAGGLQRHVPDHSQCADRRHHRALRLGRAARGLVAADRRRQRHSRAVRDRTRPWHRRGRAGDDGAAGRGHICYEALWRKDNGLDHSACSPSGTSPTPRTARSGSGCAT